LLLKHRKQNFKLIQTTILNGKGAETESAKESNTGEIDTFLEELDEPNMSLLEKQREREN